MSVDLSYTIWFAPRSGSTWFAGLLEATGVAGRAREHLDFDSGAAARAHYEVSDARGLVAAVRQRGSTPNGVFGIKQGFRQPAFDDVLEALVPGWASTYDDQSSVHGRLTAWERAFPGHRHIFLTRRNKVRLAVSWWRAIQSDEWHRERGARPSEVDLRDAYNFGAIDHLVSEATLREAGTAELFREAEVVPLTLTYEDLVLSPEREFARTLDYLGLPVVPLPGTSLSPIADEISEEWVQRYREERQQGWSNRGW